MKKGEQYLFDKYSARPNMFKKEKKIMAINLVFIARMKGLFMIRISGKEVYWNDKTSGLQMLYPDPSEYALRMGGPPTEQEVEEYNMCKTEEELESFVVRDCKIKGIKLVKREVIEE